jgi:hypothetical protein
MTSRFSFTSTIDVRRIPSNEAVGDAASSFDNQSLVGFPLYTSLPLITRWPDQRETGIQRLGMTFTFGDDRLIVDMKDYTTTMLTDFPFALDSKTAPTPAADNLFHIRDSSPIDKLRADIFHTFVAKGLFACKRARPDIHTTIAFLCTRVRAPTEEDWEKLLRLMYSLNGSKDEVLFLAADDLHVVKWYVDASYAVHRDFRSHTGGAMTYGTGVPISVSKKQELNTNSSTEAELVGVDDATTLILWTKFFWRLRVITSLETSSMSIIKALYFWSEMEKDLQANAPEQSTFDIFRNRPN